MAIMSALVMYVIPALIGRSYDLRKETVGPDIFTKEEVEAKVKIIPKFLTTSEYKVVSELSEVVDFLDVSGKASLKLKVGSANVQGSGSYLKDASNFRNKVDLLVKVNYETKIYTLTSDAKPILNWQKDNKNFPATHYIRSILYGGELIASVRFTTANEADKNTIKGMVQASMNAKSGSFGAGLKANLEKIKNKVSKKAMMDINYYATVPLDTIPRSIDGLIELIDKFPEQTKKVNKGLGVPLKMELFSLQGIEKDRKAYWQSLAFTDQMMLMDEMLSDIRNAKQGLSNWMQTIPPVLPRDEKNKVGQFQTKLDNLDRIFSKTIAELDLKPDASKEQFKPAFEAYRGGSDKAAVADMYLKEFKKLKEEIMLNNNAPFEADFGGRQFIYWGSKNCSGNAITIYSGTMASTSTKNADSSEFVCMPDERQQIQGVSPKHHDESEDITIAQIVPVSYRTRKLGYHTDSLVNCSSCRIPGKSSLVTMIGKTECPEGWTRQYEGILASADDDVVRGNLVCVDQKEMHDGPGRVDEATILTEVSPDCDAFPCQSSGVSEKHALPCVVCSVTKKTNSLLQTMRL